jgi:hypothetical protein
MTNPFVRPNIVRSSIRIAFCLGALLPARIALADYDSGDARVDVVVNMTDAGRKVPPPTPDNPAYYYPVTRGYTQGGTILTGEKPPPPTVEVEHLMAKALAEQGYLVATSHPPSLVLIFWWGYKAPEITGPGSGMAGNGYAAQALSGYTAGPQPVGSSLASQQIVNVARMGLLPVNISANHDEMEELVFGSDFDLDSLQNDGGHPSPRLEALTNASRVARYYLMVSALDFKSATQKKPVVLWTARVSTELWSHTLDQVLPTLIAKGAPMFGRDSDGPQMTTAPIVPMGHVIVGTPVLKTDASGSAIPKASP